MTPFVVLERYADFVHRTPVILLCWGLQHQNQNILSLNIQSGVLHTVHHMRRARQILATVLAQTPAPKHNRAISGGARHLRMPPRYNHCWPEQYRTRMSKTGHSFEILETG